MVMGGDLTRGSEHTTQCTEDMLWNRAPETWKMLISVTPIHSMKRRKGLCYCQHNNFHYYNFNCPVPCFPLVLFSKIKMALF